MAHPPRGQPAPRVGPSVERPLHDPVRSREAGWIVLQHARGHVNDTVQRDLWGTPDSVLRREPAFLRACLDKDEDHALGILFSVPLPPTLEILQDQDLVVRIVQRYPAFLRHDGTPPPPRSSSPIEASSKPPSKAYCIRRPIPMCHFVTSSDANVLSLFSEDLRNNSELVLSTLRTLRHLRRFPDDTSFVGPTLCDDAVFCVRAAEELAVPPPTPKVVVRTYEERLDCWELQRRTLKTVSSGLLDLSDRLRHDPAVVVTAFCCPDA